MQVDETDRAADIEAAFDDYEHALTTNDVDTLDRLFWQDPRALRYGAAENLVGHDEIKAFRVRRSPELLEREVLDRHVTCFEGRFAVTNITFRKAGEVRVGRQSQSWVRFHEGWRIVAAHVSWMEVPCP